MSDVSLVGCVMYNCKSEGKVCTYIFDKQAYHLVTVSLQDAILLSCQTVSFDVRNIFDFI